LRDYGRKRETRGKERGVKVVELRRERPQRKKLASSLYQKTLRLNGIKRGSVPVGKKGRVFLGGMAGKSERRKPKGENLREGQKYPFFKIFLKERN